MNPQDRQLSHNGTLPLLDVDAIATVAAAANRCPLLLPPQLLPLCIILFSLMMFKILLRPSIILNIFSWCDPGQPTIYHPSYSTYWPMWLQELRDGGYAVWELEKSMVIFFVIFYANDKYLASRDAKILQPALDNLVGLFEPVWLQTNTLRCRL